MGTRLSDSDAVRAPVGHRASWRRSSRSAPGCRRWLDILAALAAAQARLGMIPAEAADGRSPHARERSCSTSTSSPRETRLTSHSMLGPDPRPAADPAGVGARSTSTSAPPCRTSPTPGSPWRCGDVGGRGRGAICGAIEDTLLALAARASRHRDGRPHARPARLRRSRSASRSRPGPTRSAAIWSGCARDAPRWLVGQLGGAVGVLGFFAPHGAAAARASSAPSSAWPTRASPGSPPGTGSPSSAACWR